MRIFYIFQFHLLRESFLVAVMNLWKFIKYNVDSAVKSIELIINNSFFRKKISTAEKIKIQSFGLENVSKMMKAIYIDI